jgi:hypothetical protein
MARQASGSNRVSGTSTQRKLLQRAYEMAPEPYDASGISFAFQ